VRNCAINKTRGVSGECPLRVKKATCAPQKVMSALPPKATLNAFSPDVR
jgi:hypothetical protein